MDFGHFAWVHDGYLADSHHPEVPEHKIFREGTELRFEYPELVEPVNQTKKGNFWLDQKFFITIMLDYNYASDYFSNLRNFDAHRIDNYVVGNANVSWKSEDERWDILVGLAAISGTTGSKNQIAPFITNDQSWSVRSRLPVLFRNP